MEVREGLRSTGLEGDVLIKRIGMGSMETADFDSMDSSLSICLSPSMHGEILQS